MTVVESAGFAVPLARDASGALVAPERATKRGTYRCPLCDGGVDLRAGERRRRHFRHRTTTSACGAESVAHFSAKEAIVEAVRAWRAGGDAPIFVRRCGVEACDRTVRQTMPGKVVRAVTEMRLRSGRIVDVALLGLADLIVAAIEVHHAHRVDDDKAIDLGVPWLEVEAGDVCRSEGRELVAVRDKLRPWLCADHGEERRTVGTADRELALRRASALRALRFDPNAFPAFAIDRIVRCRNGHDAVIWKWSARKAPPWPRPPTLVAREAGDFRRTWVSVCALCTAELT